MIRQLTDCVVAALSAFVLAAALAISLGIGRGGLLAQAPALPTAAAPTEAQQVDGLRRALGQAQQQLGAANRQLGACSGDLLTIQGQETSGDLVAASAADAAHRAAFDKANPGKTVDKDWKMIDRPAKAGGDR